MRYYAVIETPDGLTYEQPYKEFEDLVFLITNVLGRGYKVVAIY